MLHANQYATGKRLGEKLIEKILKQEKIPYKVIDEDKGYKLIKINSKIHLFYMNDRGNQFKMERDFFDYLDGNSIPYSILCHDTSRDIFYYLKLNKKANWVKSCFETCDKESIYLGKQILNAEIGKAELCKVLKMTM